MDKLNVLLVDDHPIFLKGLVEVIQDEFHDFVIHSFSSPELAFDSAKSLKYNLAISDLDMPKMNGISLITELKILYPEILTILLTMHKEQDIMRSALVNGIDGYVLKDDVVDELVIAIEEVLKGNKYISELEVINEQDEQIEELKSLTKTELLVLKGISDNKTSKEIANDLFVSLKTIENHRNNISRKLRLKGSNSLLKFAINNKNLL
ncbi:response regulator transcription factor [Flavobacterium jejuense]|uniref:Response regulator transcription factor n=1 Tax=Flavobacterium jejuense TaxID=1544455 RepID=A0ABX0IKV2_9FLAO|nr:response regulator transcription factor [Flavobacterium jejuense]NHN24213.1 response regulator transcription factor [Flavobacterium jejuense]